MSGLSNEQIKAILSRPKRTGGGKKKAGPDTSIRDVTTWFALSTKTRDELTGEDLRCDNPNCVDPRPAKITALGNEVKHQFVVELNGQLCCRHCFLDGWLLQDPAQQVIDG